MDETFAFPDDENGAALRRMRTEGDDLARPRTIDFEHQFPNKSDALLFLAEICGGETKVSISRAGQSNTWNVQVSIYMILTYAAITEAETRLGSTARGFGGSPDGWGCFNVKRES
jgi:Regulator of ribonuclease activity B